VISCEELGTFVDELCDLTREMPDMNRLHEAKGLAEKAKLAHQFIMQWRAAAVADLHYLEGRPVREISREIGNAYQGVSQWLVSYGPTHYLMVRKVADRPAELKLMAVDGESTKRKARDYRQAGYRIAPSTLNLLEGDQLRVGIDPEQLWNRLAPEQVTAA
jgi:hypothetical protein